MNNKGQALVEFILILPVLILIIFSMIEIGNLIHQKYILETHIDPLIELYENDKDLIPLYETKENIKASFTKNGDMINIEVSKDVKLITPGVNKFLSNPYEIKANRSFYVGD